jgi:ACS family hexuronate transporter-like MFS transporter
MFLSGFLVDRFPVRWIYLTALLVWSAAGVASGLVGTIQALVACRMVLGVAEAFNWPCAVSLVQRLLPIEARSLANGIFHSGASLGAAATPILAWAMIGPAGERWRSLFVVVGAAGAAWSVLWLLVVRGERVREIERPAPAPATADAEARAEAAPRADVPPFLSVLVSRRFWIAMTVSLTVNVCWHFFRAWLPRILKKDLGYGESQMLWMLAAFFVAADLGSLTAGWATRRLTRAGLTVERSRKLVGTGTSLLCLLAVPVVLAPQSAWAMPLIMVLAAGAMGGFANMFSLAQETAPGHTAKVVGLVSSVPWLVLAALNPIVGELADRSGTFAPTVIGVAFVPLCGSLVGWCWPERSPARAAT